MGTAALLTACGAPPDAGRPTDQHTSDRTAVAKVNSGRSRFGPALPTRAARNRPALPVIGYGRAPAGFPPDPHPLSVAPPTEAVRPTRRLIAYDAPGGRARAVLPPTINGAQLTVPIVARRPGWVAIPLPSANRRLAWLRTGGWTRVELRDQLVVVRTAHELRWLRGGSLVRSWRVTLGAPATPTPLGRTFIMGRSRQPGAVYAGVKVYALGAVPDDPAAIPVSLRGAHIGIHAWHHDRDLGRSTSDGCIRLTRTGQETLLAEVPSGTQVVVVDRLP